jgi:density-regulated protein
MLPFSEECCWLIYACQVTIKRIERNKRKFVTSVYGLEAFGTHACAADQICLAWSLLDIDLKKASKLFAQRFATGASVTKNTAGQDEIVVQGDVSQEIYDMIEEANEASGQSGKKGLDVLKGVLIDNVEMVEEKKKKNAE